ncbi:MAG: VanZ family protein [Zoogloea sp.]|nr:VanZ family protein [Zoogloea sp.]
MPDRPVASPLARHLAFAYGVLIVYACLHPFSGWRYSGIPLWDFLTAPWPRYYRGSDLVVNVLGFMPFGFVLVPAISPAWKRGWAVLTAVLIAALLSLSLETLQNFLPTRVASNVDLGCNTLGGLIGALAGVRWGGPLFDPRAGLARWRKRRFLAGHLGDFGLVLLGLWLLTQLTPESLLFGIGDLRPLFDLPAPVAFSPGRFMKLEAAIAATQLLALGLIARCMMREPSPWPILLLILLGLGAKTLAAVSFFVPGQPLHWATPGGQIGLAAGAGALAIALLLPRTLQAMLAGTTLLVGTALVNLAPDNPYLMTDVVLIKQGNFLNFHGLTQLSASLWPFIALAYLFALGAFGPRNGGLR